MTILSKTVRRKPSGHYLAWWLFLFIGYSLFHSCTKEPVRHTTLFLKTGVAYTSNGDYIPTGGKIRIGILASGGGAALTYIRIDRITSEDTTIQLDRGIYADSSGFEADFIFSKDTAQYEHWRVLMMNADRDTAMLSFTVFRGQGSSLGEITYFPSVVIGFQENIQFGNFLDADAGQVYSHSSVSGKESDIDILGYYYVTSGLPSPSLSCPGYTAASGHYPELNSWPVKNTSLYDYKSTDNNLISIEQFEAAENDSLLVTAYKPDKVSGNCKYCYTGKVIPFKTAIGKYGLIKVIRADQTENGSMELAIKIQK